MQVTGRAAEDVVLFTGTGATGAVAKLVNALGLSVPLPPGVKMDERRVISEAQSNFLPPCARNLPDELVSYGQPNSRTVTPQSQWHSIFAQSPSKLIGAFGARQSSFRVPGIDTDNKR